MLIHIPDNVRVALHILERNGFEAYAVGGCVRDSMLGRKPNDWDICTSALPNETQKCFEGYKTIPTGVKHGTITVILDSPIEITTYRIDGEYSDHRRPETVEFTRKLANDLARRDFTVNAMAVGLSGEVVDLYGGTDDLLCGAIRCVGEPSRRFNEDALRIMRALRFASTLEFNIEDSTAEAIHEQCGLLKAIAVERIHAELNKLLSGDCERILTDFEDVFGVIMPEALPITAEKVTAVVRAESLPVKLALLGGDGACSALVRLKYDKATLANVEKLTTYSGFFVTPDKPCAKRLLNSLGKEKTHMLLEYKLAKDDIIPAVKIRFEGLINAITDAGECYTLSALAVNGRDVAAMSFVPENLVGKVLEFLLNAVIDEKVSNSRAELLEYARTEFKY